MDFTIDTSFNRLLRDRERLLRENIDLEELAEKIDVSSDTIKAFDKSHVKSIVDIPIIDFIKVAEYFNINIGEFIEYHLQYDAAYKEKE